MKTQKFDFEIKIFKPEYQITFNIEDVHENQKKLDELEKTNPFTEGKIIEHSNEIGHKKKITDMRCYPYLEVGNQIYKNHCSPAQGFKGEIKATNILEAIRKIMNETNDQKIDYLEISYQNPSDDTCELTYNKGLIQWRNYEKQKCVYMKQNSNSYKTLDRIINK